MNIREGYKSEQVRNEAFKEVSKQLSTLQYEVYSIIKQHEPITNEEIAEKLDKFPHEICPRVLELRKLDLVEFAGKKKAPSGRNASKWKLKKSQTTLNFN
jgi:predicted ArsR family transcriptional regulator